VKIIHLPVLHLGNIGCCSGRYSVIRKIDACLLSAAALTGYSGIG